MPALSPSISSKRDVLPLPTDAEAKYAHQRSCRCSRRSREPLAVTHEIQLSSYSYLFRHSSQQPEAALEIRNLVKTKTPKIEVHRYPAPDERHYQRLFAVVRAYLDDLDPGRFVFRPGIACGMCDLVDDHCRAWDG